MNPTDGISLTEAAQALERLAQELTESQKAEIVRQLALDLLGLQPGERLQ